MNIEELLINLFKVKEEIVSTSDIILRISFAFIFSFLISIINYYTYTGERYDKSIIHAQILATIIFALMINVLGKNLAIAVGIFGSLSFIQFRTTMKDPKDTVIFFYSVIMGVAFGSGYFKVAIIGFIFITLSQVILKFISFEKKKKFSISIEFETSDKLIELDEFFNQNKILFITEEIQFQKSKIKYIIQDKRYSKKDFIYLLNDRFKNSIKQIQISDFEP
jgi:hypothetical protein